VYHARLLKSKQVTQKELNIIFAVPAAALTKLATGVTF
jgi:hypothetical protein